MKRKAIPRWFLRTVIAVFLALAILLLASVLVWQSKKETCRGVWDVWADVGILVSQHNSKNPDALDYTKSVNMIDLYGWVIYPEGDEDAMVGYISELTIAASESEGETESAQTRTVCTSDYADDFTDANELSDKTSPAFIATLLDHRGTYFDFSVSKYMK